jgi:mannose-6-phosphate isomerase-like protein (cupin superfamily)
MELHLYRFRILATRNDIGYGTSKIMKVGEKIPVSASFVDTTLIHHTAEQGWQSTDLLPFNRNNMRYRTMNDVEAQWHTHFDTDELFFVLSGDLEVDIRGADGEITTYNLGPLQMLAVHPGCEHRARSKGLTTLIVIDAISK